MGRIFDSGIDIEFHIHYLQTYWYCGPVVRTVGLGVKATGGHRFDSSAPEVLAFFSGFSLYGESLYLYRYREFLYTEYHRTIILPEILHVHVWRIAVVCSFNVPVAQ